MESLNDQYSLIYFELLLVAASKSDQATLKFIASSTKERI